MASASPTTLPLPLGSLPVPAGSCFSRPQSAGSAPRATHAPAVRTRRQAGARARSCAFLRGAGRGPGGHASRPAPRPRAPGAAAPAAGLLGPPSSPPQRPAPRHRGFHLRRRTARPLQGFHTVLPACPRLVPRLRGPRPAGVSGSWDPRRGGRYYTEAGWEQSLGFPGRRESVLHLEAHDLASCRSWSDACVWMCVKSQGGVACGCCTVCAYFVGLETGVFGVGAVEAPVPWLRVGQGDARPGYLCARWSQAHPPTRALEVRPFMW